MAGFMSRNNVRFSGRGGDCGDDLIFLTRTRPLHIVGPPKARESSSKEFLASGAASATETAVFSKPAGWMDSFGGQAVTRMAQGGLFSWKITSQTGDPDRKTSSMRSPKRCLITSEKHSRCAAGATNSHISPKSSRRKGPGPAGTTSDRKTSRK
jgi:hypothetical protein